MANNYLITGYWGEPHVTAENDRGINAAIFGAGRFVLPVGEQFRAEYIGNNTIRIYDGKLINNGAVGGIPAGEYVDVLISNASQGRKRNDLIVFQYSQDASTLIESGTFVVVKGTETSGTATDPELTQADLLSGEAVFDQMALWRVSVSGGTIAAPEKVFSVSNNLSTLKAIMEADGTTVKLASQALSPKIQFLSDYTNLDNITTAGWYYGYYLTNSPQSNLPQVIEVVRYSNDWMMQRCVVMSEGGFTCYQRALLGGSGWSSWATVVDSNTTTYAKKTELSKWDSGTAAFSDFTSAKALFTMPTGKTVSSIRSISFFGKSVYLHGVMAGAPAYDGGVLKMTLRCVGTGVSGSTMITETATVRLYETGGKLYLAIDNAHTISSGQSAVTAITGYGTGTKYFFVEFM